MLEFRIIHRMASADERMDISFFRAKSKDGAISEGFVPRPEHGVPR